MSVFHFKNIVASGCDFLHLNT